MLFRREVIVLLVSVWVSLCQAGEKVRLATYNLENYVLADTPTRKAKTEESRSQITRILKSLNADVLALQEVGGRPALEDLQSRLKEAGLDYPHAELVQGWDTNIQVAVLSQLPFARRRPHTRDTYLASGRRYHVNRGILETDIQASRGYVLTLFVVHLKSRRTSVEGDEAEMRLAEARILREKVDARLSENPRANIVVMGDLNDTKDSLPVRTILGRGRGRLVDTRPGERNGDSGYTPDSRWEPRTVTWTHYYGKEDTYSRIDYILLHANAEREWLPRESYLPVIANWGLASDHRPVVITLDCIDR